MAKKKTDQLELLNAKFDKLIEVLLSQKSQLQSVETKTVATKDKEVEVDVILKYETKPVQPKKIISFFVDPNAMITINGVPYEGNVTVEEGLATVIRRMICDWQRYNNNILRDVTHPTRQHIINGKI